MILQHEDVGALQHVRDRQALRIDRRADRPALEVHRHGRSGCTAAPSPPARSSCGSAAPVGFGQVRAAIDGGTLCRVVLEHRAADDLARVPVGVEQRRVRDDDVRRMPSTSCAYQSGKVSLSPTVTSMPYGSTELSRSRAKSRGVGLAGARRGGPVGEQRNEREREHRRRDGERASRRPLDRLAADRHASRVR